MKPRIIGSYGFDFICKINPEQNPDGSLTKLFPQDRYHGAGKIQLNNYGRGPFCKFKIENKFNFSGVYALTINQEVQYIGECIDLSSRYNSGYGNISPRNCFVGGQETNCRINNLICNVSTQGQKVSLWLLETSNYKQIEYELRKMLRPQWNLV